VEAAVYFTVLEALQNTTKYADATAASVLLREDGGVLTFEVRDDGRGFVVDAVQAGAGLSNMADRLDAVGGSYSLASKPGTGTTVSGRVPLVPAGVR
jgi:signal transduction histidine kinase